MARKNQTSFSPPSPGETVRRYILVGARQPQEARPPPRGVYRQTVNQLINGKRSVTAEMALRLARVLNTSPDFWLNLQRGVDLFEAKLAIAKDLEKMPVLRRVAV